MKTLIFIPIVISIITGVGMKIVDVAEQTGEKTVQFSNEVNSMVDCAFVGVNIDRRSNVYKDQHDLLKKDLIKFSEQLSNGSFVENELIQDEIVGLSFESEGSRMLWGLKLIEVNKDSIELDVVDFTKNKEIFIKSIKQNQKTAMDLNYDGIDDLQIELLEVKEGKAKIKLYETDNLLPSNIDFLTILATFLLSFIISEKIAQKNIHDRLKKQNNRLSYKNIEMLSTKKGLIFYRGGKLEKYLEHNNIKTNLKKFIAAFRLRKQLKLPTHTVYTLIKAS